ncbi:UNVERIFIED_CONTAM: hypothetical protein Sradi_6654200 [Sesamum radiatum]|uniref:Retrotransposon gag domain-containing protein n=1 Tax=Sesamum radiatum TaxID=300843 RepID=A0AAW2JQS9_SESRA
MKPHGITDEQLNLRAFPFSLKDKAKDWLYYLHSGSIETWADMKQQFLQRFFPASRATHLRKEIYGIRQDATVGLQEAREGLQETRANLQHLGNQISQLATSVSKLEVQASGKLPSQTETNPRENVSAITLRSGKKLQHTGPTPKKARIERNALDDTDATHDEVDSNLVPPPLSNTRALPFPYRMSKYKEEEHEKEILDTFKKVEINIPLLDAIKQIPKYAKFLELCTNKRKLKDKERIIFGKNVSAVINRKLPKKCKDPDFYILKMGLEGVNNPVSILLGRPFMKTAKTKIDVDEGTLSVEFGGEIVKFNISEAMKYPNELQALYQIDVIDSVVHDVVEEELVGTELDLIMELDENDVEDEFVETLSEALRPPLLDKSNYSTTHSKLLPSVLQVPKLELKPLP